MKTNPNMKTLWGKLLGLGLGLLFSLHAGATTFYVNVSNSVPVAPYTNWLTAATNIQDAVDAATNGDTVLVTNGVYATGGQKWVDSGSNRVTVTKSLILQSVNGSAATFIQGRQATGTNAVRCVMLATMNAVLSGFTLTNGQSGVGNYPLAGGVFCNDYSDTVSNCVLAGNLANLGNGCGGAVYCGTLVNCILKGNSAGGLGGGAYNSTLINCTICSNSATNSGGGVYGGSLTNCILFYNSAPSGPNYSSGVFSYCDTMPLPSGIGNIAATPLFVNLTNDFHLKSNSPCINAGNNAFVIGRNDLDGNPRIVGGTVDIGAYEYQTPASNLSYAWAQQYGLPTDGSADNADFDGDGMNNWQEWIAGTNPTNAASVLKLASPTNSFSGMKVMWQSVSGVTYYLQRSTNLSSQPPFTALVSNLTGQAVSTSYTDASATNATPYFYLIGVQ